MPLTALHSSLLLSRGEWSLELTVDEEIAKNPAWAPWDAIGPALDARRVLFIDKDVPALNKSSTLSVVGPPSHVIQDTAETGLEEEKAIMRRSDMAIKSRDERSG
jgi:hypothetical protein